MDRLLITGLAFALGFVVAHAIKRPTLAPAPAHPLRAPRQRPSNEMRVPEPVAQRIFFSRN